MKSKIWCFLIVLACLTALTVGCTETTEKHTCAKCGRPATSTMSGPAATMQSYGIPLSACREITSGIYTAYICSSCTGPVVELKPN